MSGTDVPPVFLAFDANGNIGQVLDATDPTNLLAHDEYDPYGNTRETPRHIR